MPPFNLDNLEVSPISMANLIASIPLASKNSPLLKNVKVFFFKILLSMVVTDIVGEITIAYS